MTTEYKHKASLKPPITLAVFSSDIQRNFGEGRIIEALVLRLAKRGYKVHLFTAHLDSQVETNEQIHLHKVKIVLWKNISTFFQFGLLAPFYYWRITQKQNADLIIGNGLMTLFLKQDLNICAYCHSTWQILGQFSAKDNSGNLKRWKTFLLKWFKHYLVFNEQQIYPLFVKKTLAISTFTRQNLIEDAHYLPERVGVVTVGVDVEEFQPVQSLEKKHQVQVELGLAANQEKIYLVFAGDLKSPRKGLQFLLRVLDNLKDPRLHLIVAGNPHLSPYVEQVKTLRLSDQVSFIGLQSNMVKVYQAGDIFVFPSLYDAWGLVVSEAMACGLPVITSASCGASQMITTGYDGYVISRGSDEEALKQAIEELTNNPSKLTECSKRARLKALDYSWERVTDQLEIEIAQAISAKTKKRFKY